MINKKKIDVARYLEKINNKIKHLKLNCSDNYLYLIF